MAPVPSTRAVCLGVCSIALAALGNGSQIGAIQAQIDPATGSFNVSLGGAVWLRGLPPAAGWPGAGNLHLSVPGQVSKGSDPSLGSFTQTAFSWTADDGTPVETAFKVFDDGETLLLTQSFPKGVAATGSSNPSGAVLAFPRFAAGGREQDLGAITWAGAFSQDKVGAGVTLSSLPGSAVDRSNGGPVLVFDETDEYRSLVVSPFDNFLASSMYINGYAPGATCSGHNQSCMALTGVDAAGPSVRDLHHTDNATRAECCQLCTARADCEMWAFGDLNAKGLPGETATCWLTAGGVGTKRSADRDLGCPARPPVSNHSTASPWWSVGISGEVEALPPGFTHSTILSGGVGITGGLQSWGSKMQTVYKTTRVSDVGLTHLSYWTDNGAYYYLYGARVPDGCDNLAHGRMDNVLDNLTASWQRLDVPVHSVQLDDWWYVGGSDSPLDAASHDHMCVRELKGKPSLWPDGIPALPKGMGYTLYGPFFCPDSVYGAKFPMENSTDGHNAEPAPDAAEAFYSSLFSDQLQKGVPMTGFEVDFLQDQTTWFAYMVQQHDGAAKWLSGMGTAAAAHNLSVQFCMAHPAAFLHALQLPAVTNGRASGDYQDPAGNLLSYGTAAPFFSAVGIAPSKDNWWSTPNQPRPRNLGPAGPPPCDGGSRNVTNTFLHALVATLSTGPVGFSDALGYTNATLVLSTCATDGLLLKPSRPLAAIDRTFSRSPSAAGVDSSSGPTVPAGSHVWATHTTIGNFTWYYALSLLENGALTPFDLLRSDVWPPLGDTDVVAWDYADPIGTATHISGSTSRLATLSGDGHSYWIVAPMHSSGWALLGEPTKLTPVSVQRAFSLQFTGNGGLAVSMAGAPNETCTVMAWKASTVHTRQVTIGPDGFGIATFESPVRVLRYN